MTDTVKPIVEWAAHTFSSKETVMEAKTWGKRMLDRNGILYPMLVIAAVSAIIFSILGITMMRE